MDPLAIKPGLVRADTLDLQQAQPTASAKDHSRQYGYNHAGGPLGNPGAHHIQALRHATQEAFSEQKQSPRVDHLNHGHTGHTAHLYDDEEDEEEEEEEEDEEEDEDGEDIHPGLSGAQHDDDYGEDGDSQDELDDEMLDKISSSPSIEDEDIDFEFVYALHTFVATVEGQANATKGDTMVLLDDSNSYWWLVRVVKDGSIGYLPAEHIETPTERLARLNKHRNIDLSAAMLGDDPAKSKNPLKKAMRRRNAKNVNFAPPTYYEPPEQDWSDDDEMDDVDDGQFMNAQNASSETHQQETQQVHSDKPVEQQAQRLLQTTDQPQQLGATSTDLTTQPVAASIQSTHPGTLDSEGSASSVANGSVVASGLGSSDDMAQRSRKGVVRNTDSFYRDNSVETKKISLTPQLLRGDSAINVNGDQEPREKQSADTFEKVLADERPKDGKPKKEKKGMLSGLFKRKDKSGKPGRADDEERFSDESGRSPPSKESSESTDATPERRPSKLQKTPQAAAAAMMKTQAPIVQGSNVPSNAPSIGAAAPVQPRTSGVPPAQPEGIEPADMSHSKQLSKEFVAESQHPPGRFPSLNEKRSVFAPISTALRSKNSNPEVGETIKPVYAKRAKERFTIDDSGSEDDGKEGKQMSAGAGHVPKSALHRSISPLNAHDAAVARTGSIARVSPLPVETDSNAVHNTREVPNGMESAASKIQAVQGSPTRVMSQTPTAGNAGSPSEQTSSTPKDSPATTQTSTTSRLTPTWSDASLRSYMDNDQDIRDLLIIVHDKSNVTPVGPDHPLMKNLFMAERNKLNDMQSQLDSMLVGWLAKRGQAVSMKA